MTCVSVEEKMDFIMEKLKITPCDESMAAIQVNDKAYNVVHSNTHIENQHLDLTDSNLVSCTFMASNVLTQNCGFLFFFFRPFGYRS